MNSMLVQEIKALYEEGGLRVDEISQELGLEEAAIKLTLKSVSREYIQKEVFGKNQNVGLVVDKKGQVINKPAEQITDEEDDLIIGALKELGFSSEDDRVRLNALIYLHDEKRGRNDKKIDGEGELKINVITLNGAIREAQKAIGVGSYDDIIDIESVSA